jgi:hypothetical protein
VGVVLAPYNFESSSLTGAGTSIKSR